MAMVVAIEKSRKSEKRPWMLRDYLIDDVSSCSSNGFRSFPRRQCCVAVKNMVENNNQTNNKPPKGFPRNRCFSSAIHRASTAIINAVKFLPLKSTVEKNRLLPRSFSKKLFTRSFWMRNGGERKKLMVKEEEACDDEIERWISSGVVGSEKYRPLDLSNDTVTSSNSNTNSDGKSDSWSDITFSSSDNDVIIERRRKSPVKVTEKGNVGVGVGDSNGSITPPVTKCVRSKDDEQQHFSPISVLEFSDSNEESSTFTNTISDSKGTKERLMKKLGRFDSILETQLEPINLESLFSVTKFDHLSPEFSIQSCQTPSYVISSESEEDEEIHNEVSSKSKDSKDEIQMNGEERVQHLLDVIRTNIMATNNVQLDEIDTQLLRDFFGEHIMVKKEHTLMKAANDWLNGHHDKLILGWEIEEKRQAYIRDMEEEGKWTKDTKLEESEVAIELGGEVLTHLLIEEVLIEICNS